MWANCHWTQMKSVNFGKIHKMLQCQHISKTKVQRMNTCKLDRSVQHRAVPPHELAHIITLWHSETWWLLVQTPRRTVPVAVLAFVSSDPCVQILELHGMLLWVITCHVPNSPNFANFQCCITEFSLIACTGISKFSKKTLNSLLCSDIMWCMQHLQHLFVRFLNKFKIL